MLRIFMKLGKYVPEKPREGELMKPPLGVANAWNVGNKRYETYEIKRNQWNLWNIKFILFIWIKNLLFLHKGAAFYLHSQYNFLKHILASLLIHCRPETQKQRVRVFFSRRAFGATREKNSNPLFLRFVPQCALRAEFF